jgi:hypothetical protein
MIGLLDYGFSSPQRMPNDEISEVSVLQRNGPQEHRLFLGPNPKGHSAIVFDGYSWHGVPSMYIFK